jgi:hypothetical protein
MIIVHANAAFLNFLVHVDHSIYSGKIISKIGKFVNILRH